MVESKESMQENSSEDNCQEELKEPCEESKAVKKIVGKKQFSINITHARHELPLLNEIISENKWRKVENRDAKADMVWQFPLHETDSKFYELYRFKFNDKN